MNYAIFGIVLIVTGIWLLYNTKKNYEDMSKTLRIKKNKKFKILDKKKLNKVLIIQNITYAVFCLLFGTLMFLFNDSLLFGISMIGHVIINLTFDIQIKKYIISE
ncbi:hypothetical protein [Clostridium sp. ZS2-4]|uniref:hypothetical protein n=1 Tax=Clostridium sp. ZS2-4 TaxID=2987703 RepID=UPI00227AEBB3|nr:hypothetical protein [Clostridium sp. ZS2-4]MCY6354830.1 hypothetical protein [Clostridium sp. ZS2-4]